jgi:Flp pilus assembly protein protease CpaA
MEEYYFLFALGALWMLFASVQDFRTREISNWLNFSLIAFALSYRAFYSNSTGNWNFLWFGIGGVLLFDICVRRRV